MIKSFIIGLSISAGIVVGLGGVGMYGMYSIDKALGKALAQPATPTLPKADLDPSMDDAEIYRECVMTNYDGNAKDAIQACMQPLTEWKYAPAFNAEWHALMAYDHKLNAIVKAAQ